MNYMTTSLGDPQRQGEPAKKEAGRDSTPTARHTNETPVFAPGAAHGIGAAASAKRFETIRAQLARRGFELHRTEDGAMLICRWDQARSVHGLDDAERFARMVGATA